MNTTADHCEEWNVRDGANMCSLNSTESDAPAASRMSASQQEGVQEGASAARRLFLVADDLTGALDSAACFASPQNPVAVLWRPPEQGLLGNLALNTATRECSADEAGRRVARFLRLQPVTAGALRFAKLDSLLRGNAAVEIAVWISAIAPRHCVIAPAFPYQGRVTRGGQQYFLRDGQWEPTACDLAGQLRELGLVVALRQPGAPVPEGISLWDAESAEDLRAIAATGEAQDTLWCGCGGLASALAANIAPAYHSPAAALPAFPGPALGFLGTDHAVTRSQLEACAEASVGVSAGDLGDAARVQGALHSGRGVLVHPLLPAGLSRGEAAGRIASIFGELAARLEPPGVLLAAGGETLQGLCIALGTERLDLHGELLPGVALSRMRGGHFDGVPVISKSGAFGERDLLRRLLDAAGAGGSDDRRLRP